MLFPRFSKREPETIKFLQWRPERPAGAWSHRGRRWTFFGETGASQRFSGSLTGEASHVSVVQKRLGVIRKWLKIGSAEPGRACWGSDGKFYVEFSWWLWVRAAAPSFCGVWDAEACSLTSLLLFRSWGILAELFREKECRAGHTTDTASQGGGVLAVLGLKLSILM